MNVIRNPREDGEFITGLARGLSVLRVFSAERPDLSLSQIAAATELNPAVVRRCLNTLVHLGYVGQNGRRFQLKPAVMSFAAAFLESTRIEDLVEPHLRHVRDETGDSVSMAVLSDQDAIIVAHVPANRMVRLSSGVGARLPAASTALGQVLLTHMVARPGSRRLAKQSDLARLLEDVRRSGYALVRNELESGVASVAVPILRRDGSVFAAIGATAIAPKAGRSILVKSRLPALKTARERIEAQLSRYPILAHSTL